MTNKNYYAYLLRLWRNRAGAPWRSTLDNPHADEHASFASLAELIAFLEQQTGEALPAARSEEIDAGLSKAHPK